MAKTSGLGAAIQVDDATGTPQTITNDVTNFAITTPVALQDTTGVDKSAHERLALLRDGTVTLNGVFNAAANMSHVVLSSITSTAGAVARSTKVTPTAATAPSLSMELLYSSYNLTRSNAGELTWTSEGQLQDGTIPTWVNS
jgi:hypothetical protein